jgi:hypothetical protein
MRRVTSPLLWLALLAWTASAGAEAKAPQPPPQVLTQAVPQRAFQPGNYQAGGFVTRFDPKGGWTTSTSDGATAARGRYSVDNGTMIFRSTPATCENERVTYRFIPDAEGFRLEFISDSCKRAGGNYRFVLVKNTAR